MSKHINKKYARSAHSVCLSIYCLLTLFISNISYADNTRHQITPELRAMLLKAIEDNQSFDDRFHAEVWLADMSNRMRKYVPDAKERLQILRVAHYEANRVGLAPELILAVMHVESRFNRFAISRSGALGLMQVMPFWLKELKQPQANLMDIQTNVRMGCTILKHYIDIEKGNLQRALGRYNGSLGKRKYPDKVFSALGERWYKQ